MPRRLAAALVATVWLLGPRLAAAQEADEAPPVEAPTPSEDAEPSETAAETRTEVEVEVEDEAPADGLEAEQAAMTAPVVIVEEEDAEDDAESLDHEYQVGIRIGAGVPFFFGIRYASGPPCDDDGSSFCFFVGSGVVDLDLSFGVTPGLEITAMGRIGMVGVEPTENNVLQTGLGIRAYIAPESLFKLFLGARAMLDLTPSGAVSSWGDVDFGVRGEVGVQLDVLRYLGFYAQIGVNILFLRSFGVSPDATGGVQVRFP